MSGRKAILARIRAAVGRSRSASGDAARRIDAHIQQRSPGPRPTFSWDASQRVERFRERALSLASSVDAVAAMEEAPAAVARYLGEQGLTLAAVCWPEIAGLDWGGAGMQVEARRARGSDLVGITGAFCAIAETGTLVLLSGPGTPGSVSLVPETHVAILPAQRIVDCMEDAWALVRAERGAVPRVMNLVSGPSRTADIEQTVTLGAHGPYRVHIVLVR